MASPNPGLPFLAEFYEGEGLGIVDNYTILFFGAIGGKDLIGLKVELSFNGWKVYRVALEGMVQFLSHCK